jgi:hypothetical protein
MDVLRVLMIGPEGNPYENGCFVSDCYLPADYPNSPPMCKLRTTGGGTVRFNPNLYNCGKVCLSLLGTWSGEPWNAKTSTLLQLFVSIQSLILVPHPYFNEPGYECEQGTPEGAEHSKAYNDDLLPHTVAFAMLDQLLHPDPAFGDVCAAHLYLRRNHIVQQCDRWLKSIAAEHLPQLDEQVKLLKQQLQKLAGHHKHLQSLDLLAPAAPVHQWSTWSNDDSKFAHNNRSQQPPPKCHSFKRHAAGR